MSTPFSFILEYTEYILLTVNIYGKYIVTRLKGGFDGDKY